MMSRTDQIALTIILLILHLFHIHNHSMTEAYPTTLSIVNKCKYTVWPAISPGSTTTTGFFLAPGDSSIISIAISPSWSGRIWARTLCTEDTNGKFSCLTGDCASSTVECGKGNATPPVTLAEFTLNASSGIDFFKVSYVLGYNLPISIEPKAGNDVGECTAVGCDVDLNALCPSEIKVMRGSYCVACKNVCQQTSANFTHCKFFTDACPFANIDVAKVFQGICASTNYVITFCPTSTSNSSMEKGKATWKWWAWLINNIKSVVIAVLSVLAVVVVAVLVILRVSCSSGGCRYEGCRFDLGFLGRIRG